MITNQKGQRIGVASNGKSALKVIDFMGQPCFHRCAPKALGSWENREEFNNLFAKAAERIGYKKDARCKSGWKKIA